MYDPYNPYETDKTPKIEVNFKRNRISKKKTGVGTVNAGGAIIIIIFVVLCLTIFGLLSFTTSFADKKLADKNLRSVEQYYQADSKAEKKLAMIYDEVNKRTKAGYLFEVDLVKSAISGISGEVGAYESGNGIKVAYKTIIGEPDENDNVKFYLSSEIILTFDADARILYYKITKWKVVFDSGLKYDEDIYGVWEGLGGEADFDW